MLLFVNIFKIFKKSQKISSICRFLKFSKNAPIYEHFLNLIFGQKSKKKKQYTPLTSQRISFGKNLPPLGMYPSVKELPLEKIPPTNRMYPAHQSKDFL